METEAEEQKLALNSSNSSITALVPGGVVTTQNISTVIRPKGNINSLQFVKIQTPELSKKAVEQIRIADETKISKEKIKETEEEWQNNLLNWKSKRRQQLSHSVDYEPDQLADNNNDCGTRKVKTFAEMIEQRAKSGNRLSFHLQRYASTDDGEEEEEEEEDDDDNDNYTERDNEEARSSSSESETQTPLQPPVAQQPLAPARQVSSPSVRQAPPPIKQESQQVVELLPVREIIQKPLGPIASPVMPRPVSEQSLPVKKYFLPVKPVPPPNKPNPPSVVRISPPIRQSPASVHESSPPPLQQSSPEFRQQVSPPTMRTSTPVMQSISPTKSQPSPPPVVKQVTQLQCKQSPLPVKQPVRQTSQAIKSPPPPPPPLPAPFKQIALPPAKHAPLPAKQAPLPVKPAHPLTRRTVSSELRPGPQVEQISPPIEQNSPLRTPSVSPRIGPNNLSASSPQEVTPSHKSSQPKPNREDKDKTVLSISGKKRCSSCKEELGRGAAAFVVESLSLVYHTNCFRCSVCHMNLSNGFRGVDVRVHAGQLHCQNCYSKDGLSYSRV